MKLLLLPVVLLLTMLSYAQQETIHIQGRVTDVNGNPVPDVYIINYRDFDKNVSRPNGVFDFTGLPGDSMIISHVAFHRKVVTAHSLLLNPVVVLDLDSVRIEDINVSPDMKTEYELARENLKFLEELDVPRFEKIKTSNDDVVSEFVKEHNKLQRNEASSVTFVQFSPSEIIGNLFEKRKKRKKARQFSSSKK